MQHNQDLYLSYLCLKQNHPIFSKFPLEAVKIVLENAEMTEVAPKQELYNGVTGLNDNYFFIVLFGKLRLSTEAGF